MTAFDKAWGITKQQYVSRCRDPDCGEPAEVRYVSMACPDCHRKNDENQGILFDPDRADWDIDSISEQQELSERHRQCPMCKQNTGVVRYWDMVCPECHEEWMEDGE